MQRVIETQWYENKNEINKESKPTSVHIYRASHYAVMRYFTTISKSVGMIPALH